MNTITVQSTVNAPVEKVWDCWNNIKHIPGWAFASDDWQAEAIHNDLKVGGTFKNHLSAKDGSFGFDFEGTYTQVHEHRSIEFEMTDRRKVKIKFESSAGGTNVIESFEPENENPLEMQRDGWQAFLNNFKKYVEAL